MNNKEILKELEEIKQQNKQILFLLNLLVGSNNNLNKFTTKSKWLSHQTEQEKQSEEEYTKDYLKFFHKRSVPSSILNELTNEQ